MKQNEKKLNKSNEIPSTTSKVPKSDSVSNDSEAEAAPMNSQPRLASTLISCSGEGEGGSTAGEESVVESTTTSTIRSSSACNLENHQDEKETTTKAVVLRTATKSEQLDHQDGLGHGNDAKDDERKHSSDNTTNIAY